MHSAFAVSVSIRFDASGSPAGLTCPAQPSAESAAHRVWRRMMGVASSRVDVAWGCLKVGFFCAASSAALSQPREMPSEAPSERSFTCQTWTVEAGLPQNSVRAIVQTRDRYLWLGTDCGLAQFDGVAFRKFGLGEGLPSLRIWVLLEDRQGAL